MFKAVKIEIISCVAQGCVNGVFVEPIMTSSSVLETFNNKKEGSELCLTIFEQSCHCKPKTEQK